MTASLGGPEPPDWTEAELAAFEPPSTLSVTEWAETYRHLGPDVTAEPGNYSTDNMPYARAIMDALGDSVHRWVFVMKCAQSGISEAGRNWLAERVDQAPGDMLLVYPTRDLAEETIEKRVQPMFRSTKRLRRYVSARQFDFKKQRIDLLNCTIYIGWSRSANALSSRPVPYIYFDELDKILLKTGREGGAVGLAEARMITYADRAKGFGLSTPTIESGPISRHFRACSDRRHWHVPCPLCGELIKPDWSLVTWVAECEDQAAYDDPAAAQLALEAGDIHVHVRCPKCEGCISDAEWKQQTLLGQWVSEGFAPGEHPEYSSVAFHVHGLISPWIGPERLVHKYLQARQQGLEEIQNFWNSWVGVPYSEAAAAGQQVTEIPDTVMVEHALRATVPRFVVPPWASVVIAGADSKQKGHYYVVRAWGKGYRSHLLDYGETETSHELYERVFRTWPVLGSSLVHECNRLLVDVGGKFGATSKSRTDEIQRWARCDVARIFPCKGAGVQIAMKQPVKTSRYSYAPPGGAPAYEVTMTSLDTGYFKDVMADRIVMGRPENWALFHGVADDYICQMTSETRQHVETRKRGNEQIEIWRWAPKRQGLPNHYWDAENYCAAGAYMVDLDRDDLFTAKEIPQRARQSREVYEWPEQTTPDGRAWLANWR